MKGYLLVRSEGKSYGLPVGRVLEVGDATEVLSIPRKLPAVRGLTPLRGRLVPLIHLGAFLSGRPAPALEGVLRYQGSAVPLIDLRKRLGVEAPQREETRTVILEFEGGKIGLVVDAVTEVMQVAAQSVTPPPGIVKGLAAEYIAGLVVQNGRTIIVLNTNKLLNAKEKVALQGTK